MGEIIKRCGCGRMYDREGWDALQHLPNWVYDWGEVQEVRNCVCGSTIVIQVDPGTPEDEPLPDTEPAPALSRFDRV